MDARHDVPPSLADEQCRARLRAALAECAEAAARDREALATLASIADRLDRGVEAEGARIAGAADLREAARDLGRLWLDAANALQKSLRQRDDWRGPGADDLFARAVALGLRAVHGYATWNRIAGGPPTWPFRSLHALYHLAESEGLERMALDVGDGRATTAQSEYLRSLLLRRLDAPALDAAALLAADRLLAAWCLDFSLAEGAAPGLRLGMRLTEDQGLERVPAEDADEAVRRLDAGTLPERVLGLRATPGTPPALLAAFERLASELDPGADHRAEPRVRFMGQQVDVVAGFDAIAQALQAAGQGLLEIAGEPAPAPMRWSVHDVSSNAFGLVAPQAEAHALEPGMLVALRHPDGGPWLVGSIVRRVPRDDGRALYGIEGLAPRAVVTLLRAEGREDDAHAILLAGADGRGTDDGLIVRGGEATAARAFRLTLGRGSWRIRMRRRSRQGPGWELARFAVEGGGA